MSESKNAVVVGKVDLKARTPVRVIQRPINTLGPKPQRQQQKPATQSQMMAELQHVKKELRRVKESEQALLTDFYAQRDAMAMLIVAYESQDADRIAELKTELGL